MSSDTDESPTETPGTASHDPERPAKLLELMTTGWAERTESLPQPAPGAAPRARRRQALAERFPGEWLVVPTGTYRVRSNDETKNLACTGCWHGCNK